MNQQNTALKTAPDGASLAPYWSGRAPDSGDCPGIRPDGTLMSLPPLSTNATRQQVRDYFDNSWALTELLFNALATKEAFYRRPYHQLRHPMIFYYAHPAALYVNKLVIAGLLKTGVNPAFEQLFATGVDEMSWDDLYDGRNDVWPSLDEVRAYRRQVYEAVSGLIETTPLLPMRESDESPLESPLWALFMGFEHERIHFETSSVLIRELPLEDVRRPAAWPQQPAAKKAPAARMITVPACQVVLGKPRAHPSFGWDNEYGLEARQVRAFSASATLISNADMRAFIAGGGYETPEFWSEEGWSWKQFRNITMPTFWRGEAATPRLRTLFEEVPMPWDYPAIVNFHEAKAYCAFRTRQENAAAPYRLLTEAEHMALRQPEGHVANYELRYGGECGVADMPASARGFHDVFGNVWQWAEDHFHPLSGSLPHPLYPDFSTPCYDGQHHMIFGGSFASTGEMSTPFARFHFRPHFFQHAGFRIARSEEGDPTGNPRRIDKPITPTYESQEMLSKYLLMHYGNDNDIRGNAPAALPPVRHLPLRCAELVVEHAGGFDSALDLGCAVGRSSFELARHFHSVLGIDYSHEFINAARELLRAGTLPYTRKDSGEHTTPLTATIDETIDKTRLRFELGDACALPESLQAFDAVLLANVLCRLPQPAACLARMESLVKKGGALVMTTPFSWLEEYTPRENWLPGLEAVAAHLPGFELIHTEEIPFLIREHARKYEYIVTLASVWRRR